MAKNKYSTSLYFKKYTDEQLKVLIDSADNGNVVSFFSLIIHNQNIIDLKLNDIHEELKALNNPMMVSVPELSEKEIENIERLTPKSLSKTPDFEIGLKDTRPTNVIHEEKTLKEFKKHRGGGQ